MVALRCVSKRGARVRRESALSSALVCIIAPGDEVEGAEEMTIYRADGSPEVRVLIPS